MGIALVTINLFITVLLDNFNDISREEELQRKMAPLIGEGLPPPKGPSFKELCLIRTPLLH